MRHHLALAGTLLVVVAFGLLFAFSDGRELWQVATRISWPRLAVPLLLTVVSYALMALSYEGIAAAAGHPLGFRNMLGITFVSNTFNYVFATGGLSGFAVRMYLFRQARVPVTRAITISLVQGILTNVSLMGFLAAGFYFLLYGASLPWPAVAAAGTLFAVFVGLTLLVLALLAHPRLRRRSLFLAGELGYAFGKRFLSPARAPQRTQLWRMQHKLDRGLDFVLQQRRQMIAPIVYIVLDWLVTLGVLWSSFWCVQLRVPMPIIVVGFAIGMLLSLVSLIPGGLGIMEGSMSTVFSALGVPLETAVVAVLIFRFAYYVLPFLISFAFFGNSVRLARTRSA